MRIRASFFFKSDCFQTKVFRDLTNANGRAGDEPARQVAADRAWAPAGACSLLRWLRWVEVSPKRFSLPSLLTHSDRCTCPFGQMTKFCVIPFCSHRRERDGRGVVKHKDLFVKIFQVKAVVSLSAAALVAVPNSQYGNPYMSIFFCDCNPRPMCGRR